MSECAIIYSVYECEYVKSNFDGFKWKPNEITITINFE